MNGLQANYVGKLENGKVFDSSYSRGKPLTFRIGVGEVCKNLVDGAFAFEFFPSPKRILFVLRSHQLKDIHMLQTVKQSFCWQRQSFTE